MAITRRFATLSHNDEQPIRVRDIQWSKQRHTVQVGRIIITLTSMEYRLLWPLRSGKAVTYATLAWTAYQYKADDKVRMLIDKHIDRIRGKLRGTGIYVYCVLSYGYLLLPEYFLDEAELLPPVKCAHSR